MWRTSRSWSTGWILVIASCTTRPVQPGAARADPRPGRPRRGRRRRSRPRSTPGPAGVVLIVEQPRAGRFAVSRWSTCHERLNAARRTCSPAPRLRRCARSAGGAQRAPPQHPRHHQADRRQIPLRDGPSSRRHLPPRRRRPIPRRHEPGLLRQELRPRRHRQRSRCPEEGGTGGPLLHRQPGRPAVRESRKRRLLRLGPERLCVHPCRRPRRRQQPGLQAPFSVQQAEDYYDAIEWAGTQPWSNGNVGLWGMSYLAITQHTVASLQPPHLKAMIALGTDSDLYNEAIYGGGLYGEGFWTWWRRRWPATTTTASAARPTGCPACWPPRSTIPRRTVRRLDLHAARDREGDRPGVDRRPADRCRHPPARQQRDVHPTRPGSRRRSSTSSTPGSRTATQQSTIAEHIAFFDHWLKGVDNDVMDGAPVRVQVRTGQRRALRPRRERVADRADRPTGAGISTPRPSDWTGDARRNDSCASARTCPTTERRRATTPTSTAVIRSRRRPATSADAALVDRGLLHQRPDDRGPGARRLHEGRAVGVLDQQRPGRLRVPAGHRRARPRDPLRVAGAADRPGQHPPGRARPAQGVAPQARRRGRSTDYWPVHTHAEADSPAARARRDRPVEVGPPTRAPR